MDILKAKESDVVEIVSMILSEFGYSQITEEKFQKKLGRKSIRAFKAVEKGKIMGFLELQKTGKFEARINGLIVNPELRGKGLGKKLLDFALDFLEKKKIKRVHLLVRQSNTEAKKLYKEAGFNFMSLLERKIDNEPIEELELNIHSEEDESPSYVG